MGSGPQRVLAVDDDPDILDAIRLTLEDEGYLVTTTEKGEYAENLQDGTAACPDLIILDVLLSGKDGRTICRSLKNRPDTRQIPIIMISAHPGAEESVRAVGADAFLAKPWDISALIGLVEAFLGRP
ncbi:MAG: response regulator [Chloroflexia bacterium]